ncbi:hypothetical protein LTR93_011420 [Exophiala xenobiotica]|nr:hypothetical protein LTR93_011420 [Exophiala xenobiotica]
MAQSQLYDTLNGSAVISQCWGTTETGWITLFSGQERDYSGSVGRLLPSGRLKVDRSHVSLFSDETTPGEGLIQSPIEDFAKSRLISYKQLTGGVIFVTEIPRSSTGKILRGLLEQTEVDYRGHEVHGENTMAKKQ